ncbi:MAG: type II toxin-antitoxin system RelE/ParE family toxin [Cyanobacteria bacterium P01_F01_bin.42]
MIKSIKHKGLKKFCEKNDSSKINSEHVNRLRIRLSVLDVAIKIDDIDMPGWRLHQLSNERWAINVSGNWRLTFDFIDGDVFVLDYEDYH